ncbi:hypothetical protein ES695_17130 [Candidatus Atribacteria bacterium 1244-E10-H5-B2]|nr:MAG: hypothetical protein ES695_17130 [Candidatus Atribacteria bacterium 1244-E10-H5-B2]
MAKVRAPLMSFDARGKLANSLVYLGWKGLKTVRQYVIPANPKTADQQQQRGYFTTAVDEWHTDGFLSADVKAWNLLALSLKEALSGFNVYVRLKVNALIAVVTWESFTEVSPGTPAVDGTTITAKTELLTACDVYYGTKITAMFNTAEGTPVAGDLSVEITGLTASTKYYFYIKDKQDPKAARTGIYSFETTAV